MYSREWDPLQKNGGTINLSNEKDPAKLLFGALFSLRRISSQLNPLDGKRQNNLKSYSTAKYRCHFFETGTNLKFVLVTDPSIQDAQRELQHMYAQIYVDTVVRK